MDNQKKLTLHVVMAQDPNDGGYSGYFKEFPQALAEGDTKEELYVNMFKALEVLSRMNKENEKDNHFEQQEFELAVA